MGSQLNSSIGQTVAEMWRFSDFSTRRPPPCWIFKMWKFEGWKVSKGSKCTTVPNFVAIDRTVADIWRFFDFAHLAPKMVAMSVVNSRVSGPKFTKFLRDVEMTSGVLTCPFALPSCHPLWDASPKNEGIFADLAPKIGCHGNVPWAIAKGIQIEHLQPLSSF